MYVMGGATIQLDTQRVSAPFQSDLNPRSNTLTFNIMNLPLLFKSIKKNMINDYTDIPHLKKSPETV